MDQRAFDKSTSTSMNQFMNEIALFLSCSVKSYTNNVGSNILSLELSSLIKIGDLIDYFNKYPLLLFLIFSHVKK